MEKRQRLTSILRLLAFAISAASALNCDEMAVEHGANWMNVSWSLYCNLTMADTLNIFKYSLNLTDKTTPNGDFSFSYNPQCLTMECSEYEGPDMSACIQYDIDLRLDMYDGKSYNYKQAKAVMDDMRPSFPRAFGIAAKSSSSLTAVWGVPQFGEHCVKYYEACISPLDSPTGDHATNCYNVTDLTNLKYEFTGLTPCVMYHLTVKGITANGNIGDMATLRAVTDYELPGKPEKLRFRDSGYDYISFFWLPSDINKNCLDGNEAGCLETNDTQLRLPAERQQAEEDMENRLYANTLYSDVSNLKECTNYRCWIQVPQGSNNAWLKSDELIARTSAVGLKIPAPQFVTAEPTEHTIRTYWAPPTTAARCVDGYLIEWKETDSPGAEGTELGKDATDFEIMDLEACTNYTVTIRAFSENWGQSINGASASATARTLTGVPGPVGSLKQASAEGNHVTICWDPPAHNQRCVFDYEFSKTYPQSSSSTVAWLGRQTDGDQVCEEIGPEDCGQKFLFCVLAVTVEGLKGPKACTEVNTAPCRTI